MSQAKDFGLSMKEQRIGNSSSVSSSVKSLGSNNRGGRYEDDTEVHAAVKMYSSLDGMGGDAIGSKSGSGGADENDVLISEDAINELID